MAVPAINSITPMPKFTTELLRAKSSHDKTPAALLRLRGTVQRSQMIDHTLLRSGYLHSLDGAKRLA